MTDQGQETATLPEDVRQAIEGLREAATVIDKPFHRSSIEYEIENAVEVLARESLRAEQAEKALETARSDGWSHGLHSGAHLLTELKAECERQHARAEAAESSLRPAQQAVAQIIGEMWTIAMVAGQCSAEEPDNERAGMAAAESARCAVWAERLDQVFQKQEPPA